MSIQNTKSGGYKYKEFEDWFNEHIGFAMRSEYFYDDMREFNEKEKVNIIKNLRASFYAARMKED